ncbi:MAG TPA: transporter substrate-binding domain-containing protein, partial [Petrotogaceae bacterium]|nr:transporter substrate-binding domain-containing protein [Petrotogaceae bacterium]
MRITLLISLILFLSVFIYAQKVRIGVYENYPIVYKTSDNELQGILIDCFKIISEKSDYDFDFVYKTWPELLGDFENESLDIITGIAYSPQREEEYFFSSEYISSEWGQIYINSDSHITSYLDLQNKKIVYIKDSYFFDSPAGILNILKSFRIDAIFLSVDSFQQAFDLVSNNLADAAVATRYQGYFYRNTYKIKETAMMFSPIELRYAARKNDSYAIKVINYIDSQMH